MVRGRAGAPRQDAVELHHGAALYPTRHARRWLDGCDPGLAGGGEATGYHVQVVTYSTTDNTSWDPVQDSHYNPSGLLNGTTYYWRVRSENARGEGNWSLYWTFTTEAAAPGGDADLALSPTVISMAVWTGESATASVTVSNAAGEQPLTWSITSDQGWLTVQPATGTTPAGSSTSVSLTADSSGKPVGTYAATLTVSSNDPGHPTRTASVTMDVQHLAVLSPADGAIGLPIRPVLAWAPLSGDVTLEVEASSTTDSFTAAVWVYSLDDTRSGSAVRL